MTLRNRFAVLFVTFAVLISVLPGWLVWRTAQQALEAEFNERLEAVASMAARRIPGDLALAFQRGSESSRPWQEYHRELNHLRVNGLVASADVFSWSPGADFAKALVTDKPADSMSPEQRLRWVELHSALVEQAYRHGQAVSQRIVGDEGVFRYAIRRLSRPRTQPTPDDASPEPMVSERGGAAGEARVPEAAFLAVQMPVDYEARLTSARRSIILLTVVMGVLSGLAGWKVAGWIVARLHGLSRAALRIQRGWMDQPVPVTGEDEISRLARAMERMRVGIRRRDEQLRLMLSRVAHEIRNPLGGLELFASAAQESEDPKERRRILGKIRKEVLGLNVIIEEFLGFAQPGQAELSLHDVREPVQEAVELAGAEIEKHGGQLHLRFPDEPLLVLADPAQLKRVVLNLVRNASHAGETVWVEGAMVNGEVRISVRDDGPGVDPKLQNRIFEPFVSDKEKGAGLGLAIVKEIAEASGGRVELASPNNSEATADSGAEFHVYLSGPESLPTGAPEPEAEGAVR